MIWLLLIPAFFVGFLVGAFVGILCGMIVGVAIGMDDPLDFTYDVQRISGWFGAVMAMAACAACILGQPQ